MDCAGITATDCTEEFHPDEDTRMADQLSKVRGAFGDMPARARLAILGVAAVTILVMFLVVRTATGTEWVPVAENLPADKLGQAQTALDEAGIDNRVSKVGTSIEVPSAAQPKAAAALIPAGIAAKGARADCAKQSQEGGSIMAKTSAEFELMVETCRENQVANTLEQIQGVHSARVDATLPGKSLFSEEEESSKASVFVDTQGSSLSKKSVQGIQATVASSFQGMKPNAVTISDETGAVIGGDGQEDDAVASMAKLDAEAKLNSKIQSDLGSEITKIVGENNLVLTSNVELDMDVITRAVHEAKAAGENGDQLVKGETGAKELLDGATGSGVQGVAGTGGQDAVGTDAEDNRATTPDTTTTSTSGDGDYIKDDFNREYDNNVVEEAIDVAPGAVTKYRISAVVDDDVDPASADAVKELIQAWMGGNAEDSLSFTQAPIALASQAAKDKATAAGAARNIAPYVKWALLGLGLIGLAFVMRSSLRQRTAELLAPADDLLLLESGEFTPIPIAELEAALAAGEPSAERRTRIEMQRKVEKIAESNPQDIANELRRWMHQDDMAYSKQRKAG
jgi:flagellar M-ring protein FliF